MSLPWFRLYSRIIDDEKLRLLAFEDRWHFVALCCLKSDGLLDEGDSELRARKIAVKLGVQVRELEEIGRRLREVGLVNDRLEPVSWDELQYKSDNSTKRVQEYRKRQKKQSGNKAKQECNVSETPQDTDTDTEITVSNDTDGGPSQFSAADIRKAIFDTGKTILKASGVAERQAGSIIGRWRKTYSDSQVLTVLSRCQAEQPSEPVEWITKALQFENGGRRNGNGNSTATAAQRALRLIEGRGD